MYARCSNQSLILLQSKRATQSAVRCLAAVPRGIIRSSDRPVIGIRRETVNAWERRAPLAPKHVRRLVDRGIDVLIQPSNRRAFPIQDYIAAGATPSDDMSAANIIMSVKSVPIDELIADKTYAFFSHTIKAQKENMPLLDRILEKKIQLVDYEKMTDESGRRLVMFGKWAGYAGMIDILHGLGLRLLALGHHTPFLHIGLAHNYRDSHMAINALRDCGYEIALGLMPESLGPLVFVFTGSGNVSQGAQELLQHMPHEYVTVDMLPNVHQRGRRDRVYACVVEMADHLVRRDGGAFSEQEFWDHPERYDSSFATTIAPYTTVLMNCIYWAPNHPRLLTIPDAKHLLTPKAKPSPDVPGQPTLPHSMVALCDISADPGGSIEFMRECTTIDQPFVIYDADINQSSMEGGLDAPHGCLVCSIDNMPAQMPLEATTYFGDLLMPYMDELLKCDPKANFDNLDIAPIVKNSIITHQGKLTPMFEYIAHLRKEMVQSASKTKSAPAKAGESQRVLLLGAGLVSGPVVRYFANNRRVQVTAASALQSDLEKLANLGPHVNPVVCDVQTNPDSVEQLIRDHQVVISLLPYTLHPLIARLCIKHKTDLVTSSYLSDAMIALQNDALDAGITVMNECGLDPGIDHMLAMECIDQAHENEAKVRSFISFCGGLPAPECSDNPLRYKFSWSPKGVLLALMNPAKYLRNGKIVEIPPGGAMDNYEKMNFMPGFNLVGYPNRDSTVYTSLYDIENECKTLLRGTLRYEGFFETMRGLQKLNLLSDERDPLFDPNSGPHVSWKSLIARLLNQKPDIFPDSLTHLAAKQLGDGVANVELMKSLEELGLFNDEGRVDLHGSPLDTLVAHLQKKLAYAEGERDVVILHHNVLTQNQSGHFYEHRIDLVDYGEPNGYSAMARTVGYTAAIITEMILKSEIQRKGMVLPLSKDIYRPALQRLAKMGITSRSTVRQVQADQLYT